MTGPMYRRALIVDDDPILVAVAREYLQSRGVEDVMEADCGAGARRVIEAFGNDIDLILCDLNMPECNGVEFMTCLAFAKCQTAIVIASSAPPSVATSAERLAAAMGLNIIGRLAKPLNFTALDGILKFPCRSN